MDFEESPRNIPNIFPILEKYNLLTKKIEHYMDFAKTHNENLYHFQVFIDKAGTYIVDIIDHINLNKDIYYAYRDLKPFTDLVWILNDWKCIFENPDIILKTRKCINWIKKKD